MPKFRRCAPVNLSVSRYVSNTNQRASNAKISALRASQPVSFQICFLYKSADFKMLKFWRCAPLSLSVFRYVSNTNQRASKCKKFGATRQSACQVSDMFLIQISGLQNAKISAPRAFSLSIFCYVSYTNQRLSKCRNFGHYFKPLLMFLSKKFDFI
jgi:hypothetical protein